MVGTGSSCRGGPRDKPIPTPGNPRIRSRAAVALAASVVPSAPPTVDIFRNYGDAYLATPHCAKSESAIQELAKPYLSKPHSAESISGNC